MSARSRAAQYLGCAENFLLGPAQMYILERGDAQVWAFGEHHGCGASEPSGTLFCDIVERAIVDDAPIHFFLEYASGPYIDRLRVTKAWPEDHRLEAVDGHQLTALTFMVGKWERDGNVTASKRTHALDTLFDERTTVGLPETASFKEYEPFGIQALRGLAIKFGWKDIDADEPFSLKKLKDACMWIANDILDGKVLDAYEHMMADLDITPFTPKTAHRMIVSALNDALVAQSIIAKSETDVVVMYGGSSHIHRVCYILDWCGFVTKDAVQSQIPCALHNDSTALTGLIDVRGSATCRAAKASSVDMGIA